MKFEDTEINRFSAL